MLCLVGCHQKAVDATDTASCITDLKDIVKRDTLRVGTMYGATSYYYYQDEPVGYDYELAQQLAAYLNLKLDVRIAKTEMELQQMLQSGQIDVVCYNFTQSLSSEFHLIPTHGQGHMVLLQRKEPGMIQRVTDLRGQSVTVVQNSIFHQQLTHLNEETGGDIGIALTEDSVLTDSLIAQVAEGKIQYTLAYYEDYELLGHDYPNLDASVAVGFTNPIGWLTRRSSAHLNDAIDSWWASLPPREIQALHDKYWSPNEQEIVEPEKTQPKKKEKKKEVLPKVTLTPEGNISPYDALFKKYSGEIGWDWRLLAALCYKESRFNPRIRSHMGATGLMQLTVKTGGKFGLNSSNCYDPEANIRAGVQLIKHLNMMYSSVPSQQERIRFILASYNAGAAHILDAQRLAKKYGANPNVWEGNVEVYMRRLNEPKFYNDPVCRFGFFKGGSVCAYVENVLARYESYK